MEKSPLSSVKKRYLFFISQDYSFPVLRPLQDAILQRGDEVKWFMYGDEITPNYLYENEIRLSTIEEVLNYKPEAVFVPGNVVPSFIGGLKVQVFHGLPSTKAKKNGQLYHFIIRGMFDLYCTQGESSTKIFERLADKYQYFKVKETGWCKLDPLFPLESKSNTAKTIFFASTFSPRFSKAKILYPFILDMIEKYDFTWYITLHPKMDQEIVALYKSIDSENVSFIETPYIIEYFKKADLMLCDTSSIIYEFLTQKKPVITFQTEKDEDSLLNVTNIDELEEKIISSLDNLTINNQNINNHVSQFHPYEDGKSSERVLDTVEEMLEGINLPLKKKPFNFIRNFKLRRELGYWKFSFR
ncbi:MAG: CDP-glycerol: N-acetyl-beta-D-mannosaminyl-1,4-N-acetyl-D-glucosaminyldiphosphoundecaprenyl glycerophosphotransferase [uncultured Sulfurovum sp.]|uniref:CDP-glycerol: N-acetyl-beta-D-mannosaminyl-1,4-N-acetyl-D-glucosaminyldip hosphoundecaprenyl glycerophosphotransferase n=1 Tax=uncultured Sulfurovum sp. TaxID=269237 RepID=A0A6S6T4D4_9BACT|nr:MAG: CDP-glycerol: N-acetyl-beta-D-mannosaminyl-1,4-N-acetyl-D-glucosaminyldiphosphoundecaprenyl glycerophosphotransferase [uncultured Sulfurovum sp.]